MSEPVQKSSSSVLDDLSDAQFRSFGNEIALTTLLSDPSFSDLRAILQSAGLIEIQVEETPLIDNQVLPQFMGALKSAYALVPLDRVEGLHTALRSNPALQGEADYLLKTFHESGSEQVKNFAAETAKRLGIDLSKVSARTHLKPETAIVELGIDFNTLRNVSSTSNRLASNAFSSSERPRVLTHVTSDTTGSSEFKKAIVSAGATLAEAKVHEARQAHNFQKALSDIRSLLSATDQIELLKIQAIAAGIGEVSTAQRGFIEAQLTLAYDRSLIEAWRHLAGPSTDARKTEVALAF